MVSHVKPCAVCHLSPHSISCKVCDGVGEVFVVYSDNGGYMHTRAFTSKEKSFLTIKTRNLHDINQREQISTY